MEFELLDTESEKLLKELLSYNVFPKETFRGYVIDNLVQKNYVVGKNACTLKDIGPCYVVTRITQKGKSYFEMKEKYEKEKRQLSRREWIIAIVGAIVGAAITKLIDLIPIFVEWFPKK